MVHVKILIEVKEYERLKQIEEQFKTRQHVKPAESASHHQTELKEDGAEQEGSGSREQQMRKVFREELNAVWPSTSRPDPTLKTPSAPAVPNLTVPSPTEEVNYSVDTSHADTSGMDPVMAEPTYTEEDESWYYLGPL